MSLVVMADHMDDKVLVMFSSSPGAKRATPAVLIDPAETPQTTS